MLHGRDPYVGGRIMWRVMIWTDDRMYENLPDNCLCGCGQEYGGTDRGMPDRSAEGGRWVLPPLQQPMRQRCVECLAAEEKGTFRPRNEWVTQENLGPKLA